MSAQFPDLTSYSSFRAEVERGTAATLSSVQCGVTAQISAGARRHTDYPDHKEQGMSTLTKITILRMTLTTYFTLVAASAFLHHLL